MEMLQVNSENRRKKISEDRRSSILKIDRPTLADIDINKKTETKISRRSSKRVSFAETYQVKEFPKDSPQRWLRDLRNADNESEDKGSDSNRTTAGSEILGLDQLLNGQIQNGGPDSESKNLNKTIMDGVDMDETVCANTSIHQNTTLSNTVCENDSDEENKVDSLSFLNNLMKKSERSNDHEPFIKPLDESDDEEYKASSFFRGGCSGFFGSKQSDTDKDGKIGSKSFLAQLQSIKSSSKQFAKEREKREKDENQTIVFDGLDDDMEMTTNFTATLQSFQKRQSTGNVLESTRIYADSEDAMEMTRNLTTNIEVVRGDRTVTEFEASKNKANVTCQSNLTVLGRSGNHGFDQTRVFSDYDDPTANMDLTVARGGILKNTTSSTAEMCRPDSQQPKSHCSTTDTTKPQTDVSHHGKIHKQETFSKCPEVIVHIGQQEFDADMEMTEALDPTLVIADNHQGTATIKTTKEKLSKSRVLADVTAHFEADSRKEELSLPGRKRSLSVSPVEMGKENVTVHFKPVDVQSDMEFTSCLMTQVESQDKENVIAKEQTPYGVSPDQTQVFTGSESVASMEFTACVETVKTITTHVEETTSIKNKVKFLEGSNSGSGSVGIGHNGESNAPSVTKDTTGTVRNDVTRVFGSGDVTAVMELTECHMSLPVERQITNAPNLKTNKSESYGDKTRVFDTGDVTSAMELTECATFKRDLPEDNSEDKTVHFERREGSMEITMCHTGVISVSEPSGIKEMKPLNVDVTTKEKAVSPEPEQKRTNKCVECEGPVLLSCTTAQNKDEKTECVASHSEPELESKSDNVVSMKNRLSMPNRPEESVPAKTVKKSTVQRKSVPSGFMNSVSLGDNFSAQNLKRKLYSFDMLMADAKARSVKVAKLKDTSETGDINMSKDVHKTTPEPVTQNNEVSNTEDSPQTEAVTSKEINKQEISAGKFSRSMSLEITDNTHTTSDILKQGTSDQEISALEVLKNVALEEDTLDDTRLLELRMLAKKKNADIPKPVPESPTSLQKNETVSTTNNTDVEKGVLTMMSEAKRSPSHLGDNFAEDDGNLTQCNTTTALVTLLGKLNKSKIHEESPEVEQTSAPSSPVSQRIGGTLAMGKHGSPDQISSGNQKKPKLEENEARDSEENILESLKLPMEMHETVTVTSPGSSSSEVGEETTRCQQSQSAMSLSQSLLSYSLLDKKYDETEGPWNFETFCERVAISQFQPRCNRRSSFNIQPTVEANSLGEMLHLQTVTVKDTQVKGEVYKKLREELERDEKEIEEQQKSVVDNQPPLFDKLRNSQISQEEIRSCYKACHRWAKAKLKKERITVSRQCLHNIKEEKDRLCSGIDDVVTQAERVLAELESVDTMLADIDQHLDEIKSEPALTETDSKEIAELQKRLHHKTQVLKQNEEKKADILSELKERQQKLRTLESENQKQELEVLKQDDVANSGTLSQDLQQKLVALERILEWKVKELSPSRDVFLFLYGAVELSVTYDVVQHKTLDSVSLTSKLAESSTPWSHLACRLVVDAVDCTRLRGCYSSRDKLPQMLHEVSSLVSSARKLASEISWIDLRHHVSINNYRLTVSLFNTKKVQKLLLTFLFEPNGYSCTPTNCLLDVVIGKIQKQEVEELLKETVKTSQSLTKCISLVQDILNT